MIQAKLRNYLFWSILIPILIILIPIEYFNLFDSALILYGTIFFFLALIISYWFWWWHISKNKPSAMFLINGGLFVLIEWNIGWVLYQRYMFIYNYDDHYIELLNSNMWAYRIFPEVILMIWFFCWVIGRFYGERDYTEEVIPVNDRQLFLKAQDIFMKEQQIFKDAQTMFEEAQRILGKAQIVFSKAQEVFARAQEVFNSRLNEHDKVDR